MSVKSYRDLIVWQKAMDLVVVCYKVTACCQRLKHMTSNSNSSELLFQLLQTSWRVTGVRLWVTIFIISRSQTAH